MTDVTARLEVAIDGSEAVAEASRLERGLDTLKGKASGLDAQLERMKRGMDGTASSFDRAAGGATSTARAIEAMKTSTVKAVREMGGLAKAAEDMGTAAARASAGMAGLGSAATANAKALAQKRAAMQQLGVQFGDFATQVSLGANVFQAFGAQAGQAAAAATGLGGTAGRIAGFFASPWGAALTLGITVLGTLASKLWDTKDAAEDAEKAAADFAKRQLDIGNFIDSTTGKLIEQNKTLRDNAALLRQSKIDANEGTFEEGRKNAFQAVAERRGSTTPIFTAGGVTQPRYDKDLQALIDAATGDVEKLDRGLQALAKRRPELGGLSLEVSKMAAAAVDAQRQNKGLAREIDEISGKATPFAAIANRIRAETDQAFAIRQKFDEAEARIQKRLEDGVISEKRASQELRQAYGERADGLKKLEEAEEARRQAAAGARAEERATAKLAREAARNAAQDARDTEGAYARLVSSFDDVAAAGLRYASRLDDIKKAAEGGLISKEQAGEYALAAAAEQAEALARPLRALEERYDAVAAATRRYEDALKDIGDVKGLPADVADTYRAKAGENYTRDKVRAIADDVADMVAAREDLFGKPAEAGGRRMADAFEHEAIRAADAIGYLIGGKFGRTVAGIVGATKAARSGNHDQIGPAIGGRMGAAIDAYDALFGGKDKAGRPDNPLARSIGREMQKAFDPKSFAKPLEGLETGFGEFKSMLKSGDWMKAAGKAFAGAQQGKMADGVLDTLGIKSSRTGAQIGGAIGNVVGGPVGGFIGGTLGGLVGGMLKKTPKSGINLSTDAEGDFSTGGLFARGKGKGQRREATEALGGAFGDALKDLADAFGSGLAKGLNLGSLGTREDLFTFDPSGQGRTKKKFGAQQFKTEDEAIAAAIRNAIDKGVIQGIRESTKRLLTAGNDFQAALDKATRFENVFRELGQRKDPTGFALKELDKEFTELRDIFKEAGASLEEYAQLEELFQLKRKDILEQGTQDALDAMADQVASMQDYLRQLQGGPGLGLSPQNRFLNARTEFEKLETDRLAGKPVDFDLFKSIADNFLDASRGYNGSTTAFFADLAKVTTATQGFIDKAQSAIAASPAVAPVVDAITQTGATTNGLLNVNNALLQQVVQALGQSITTANDNAATIAAVAGGGGRVETNPYVRDF
jgi:hypothetical protein